MAANKQPVSRLTSSSSSSRGKTVAAKQNILNMNEQFLKQNTQNVAHKKKKKKKKKLQQQTFLNMQF